jgi:hypothetical protein
MKVDIKNYLEERHKMTIKHSENLNEILSALSKLQGKLENAKKNKTGFIKGHSYAELSQYLEISKDLLEEHGLCVLQLPGPIEIVEVTKEVYDKKNETYFFQQMMVPKQEITTWIGHESGQFISGPMEILVEKTVGNSWGQSTGVAISFGRRYAFAGGLGMTQEDNDNRLSQKDIEKSYSQSKSRPPQNQVTPSYTRIDKEQVDYIKSLLKDDPERFKKMLVWANVQSVEDLSVTAYTSAVNTLLAEQKNQSLPANKDTNLIDEKQVVFLQKLLTPERLNKILTDYKLTKIEEMKLSDYFKEYDQLRQELTISENYIPDIKQA